MAITALGFATKFYRGPGMVWTHPYGGAVLYEAFWIVCASWVRPRLDPLRVAVAVFSVTVLLEFLQLSDATPLAAVRTSFLGRTLIGTSFDALDFPHYAIGCGLGWLLVRHLRARR